MIQPEPQFPPRIASTAQPFIPRLRQRQYLVAAGLWLLALLLALQISRGIALQPSDALFFGLLYAIAAWTSASLPMSIYIARLSAALVIAAVALGVPQAMLIGVLGMLPVLAVSIPLRRALGVGVMGWRDLLFSVLWHSAAVSLALLGAGWAYGALGGTFSAVLEGTQQTWLYLLFVTLDSLLLVAFLIGWLALRGIAVRRYLRSNAPGLLSNGLLPAVFSPLVAMAYADWPHLRPVILLAFALGGLVIYQMNLAAERLSSRVDDLRLLNRIGQTLTADLDSAALLEAINREISSLIDTSDAYIALYDEETRILSFPVIYVHGQQVQVAPRVAGNGVVEYIIRQRTPLLFNRDPLEEARALGIEPVGSIPLSFVGVPILAGDQAIGAIGLRNYQHAHAFSQADVQLLQTIAAGAGSALRNARLYERSQRQAQELSLLHRITVQASSSLELDTVLRTICDEASRAMPFQKVAIFLISEDGQTLRLVQSTGLSEAFVALSREVPIDSGRAEALRSTAPVVIEDFHTDPRVAAFIHLAEAEGFAALLDLSLRSGDRPIGILSFYYAEPHHFEPAELELMQTLGAQISIAVENARLFEDTRARTRELQALFDASVSINASLSLSNVLRAAAISMLQAMQAHTCLALLAGDDRRQLRLHLQMISTAGGLVDDSSGQLTIELDALPAVQEAIRCQELTTLNRAAPTLSAGERRLLEAGGMQVALAVPLISRGKLVGLIAAGWPEEGPALMGHNTRLAEALASQAAVAIENAALFERTDLALANRLEELKSLEAISQRMTRRLDARSVIEQVMNAAAAATGAEVSEVVLYNEDADLLKMAARRDLPGTPSVVDAWPADQGATGRALQTGRVVLLDDVRLDRDYWSARPGILAELVVPILLEGRRLGVINLESTRLAAFNQEHVRFVTSLAEQAAIALENARLYEAMSRRADEFSTLRSIAVELLAASDTQRALQLIARAAQERTHARSVHIYHYDAATDRLTFRASAWDSGETNLQFATPRRNGITATVARTGERVVIRDPGQHPLFDPANRPADWPAAGVTDLGAIAGVPLKRGREVVGVLNIAFTDPAQLTEDTLRFLDFLAAQTATALIAASLNEAIRTSRDLLQAILDSSHDGILMFNTDGRLVIANSRTDWLLNARLTPLIGQRFSRVLAHLRAGPDAEIFDRAAVREIMHQLSHSPTVITRRRYTFRSPTLRAIEEVSLPVTSDEGELLGRMFILRDATYEHELEEYRDEMSHMLVHDLRSPLGGVITGLQSALQELTEGERAASGPDLPMLNALLSVSLTSARALLRLVEALLDVNKLEAGEMPLRREALDLRAAMVRAIQTLSATAEEAGITIHLEAPSGLPPVSADMDAIDRVLINLLDNAVRYTPADGDIWITLDAAPLFQTVTIRDTGEGIPPEQRERIFERFFQADTGRRKRGTKGSGLGLTFCKLAVEAHGGRIWVDEGPEGGAAFHVTLPVDQIA